MSVATLAAKPPSRRMLERKGMTPEEELELLIREQQKDDTHFVDRPSGEISLDAPAPKGEGTIGSLVGRDEDGQLISFVQPHVSLFDPTHIPHGTLGGYTNHRCRCTPCRKTNTAYRRRKRAES